MGNIPVMLGKCLAYIHSFSGCKSAGYRTGGLPLIVILLHDKVIDIDLLAVSQNHGPSQGIFEFTDVAGPIASPQFQTTGSAETQWRTPHLKSNLGKKILGKTVNVAPSLA
jgi:hypothetical protein